MQEKVLVIQTGVTPALKLVVDGAKTKWKTEPNAAADRTSNAMVRLEGGILAGILRKQYNVIEDQRQACRLQLMTNDLLAMSSSKGAKSQCKPEVVAALLSRSFQA